MANQAKGFVSKFGIGVYRDGKGGVTRFSSAIPGWVTEEGVRRALKSKGWKIRNAQSGNIDARIFDGVGGVDRKAKTVWLRNDGVSIGDHALACMLEAAKALLGEACPSIPGKDLGWLAGGVAWGILTYFPLPLHEIVIPGWVYAPEGRCVKKESDAVRRAFLEAEDALLESIDDAAARELTGVQSFAVMTCDPNLK